jgi:hypothetical protein
MMSFMRSLTARPAFGRETRESFCLPVSFKDVFLAGRDHLSLVP